MLKEKILLAAKGFCMGAADVVPGVSGGTMAFILGIYADLILAIKSFDRIWLKAVLSFSLREIWARPHFAFLIPLGLGIFSALMFFTRVIPLPRLIIDYPEQVYGLFFGLIVGSIIVLLRDMENLRFKDCLLILPGLLLGLMVFNLVPTQTPDASWFIFLSGALAICAMILPGISGSFILLLLNKYAYIFDAIGHFKFAVILPFGLGAACGLIVFTRVLSWFLARFYRQTILSIAGLLLASLYVIWPFQNRVYEVVREKTRLIASSPILPEVVEGTEIMSLGLILSGIIVVLFIQHLNKKHRP